MMGRLWKLHITEEITKKYARCGFDECGKHIRKGAQVIMVRTAKNKRHVIRLCSTDCQWNWFDERAKARLGEIE